MNAEGPNGNGSLMTLGSQCKAALSDHAMDVARSFRSDPISPQIFSGVVKFIQLFLIVSVGLAFHNGRFSATPEDEWVDTSFAIADALLAMTFIQLGNGCRLAACLNTMRCIPRVIFAWTLAFCALVCALLFFNKNGLQPRLSLLEWYLSGCLALGLFHTVLALTLQRWSRQERLQRRAIIVGGGDEAAELINTMSSPEDDIRICGIFDDRSGERSPDFVLGYPRLGTIKELVEFGRNAKINMLLISLPLTAEERLLKILQDLWVLPVEIRLSARNYKLRFRASCYSFIGSAPFFDVFDKPITDWDFVAKRCFDIVFASAALIGLSPVLIAVAVAIKLDSKGPVFFKQRRYGFNNQIINVFKFRSMYADKCDYEAKVAVTKGDPRITKVGRFIRKTSLDELPQLFNVLLGTVSLVGPRPHAIGSNTGEHLWESIIDSYFARHKVKPGVTGWAQINGWRGEIDTPEKLQRRIEHDLYYIEHWTLLFDLYIFARTPLALLNTKNAY